MGLMYRVGLALLATLTCANAVAAEAGRDLLIKEVRIVSHGRAMASEPTDILIRNGRISSIGSNAASQADNTAEILSGEGRFLSPGLIDGHTHLSEVPGMTFEHEQTYPKVANAARRQIPRSYLYHGFTTVVDLNSVPDVTEKWNLKEIRPTAYFCGAAPVFDGYPMSFMPKPVRYKIMPYFLFDQSRADQFPAGHAPADHSASAVVSRIQGDGGICVKTHHERGFGGRGDLPTPTVDLVRDLVKQAHQAGMPVLMHANSQAAQAFGLATGVDAFAHGMWTWDDKAAITLHAGITKIVASTIAAGIALQPTIQVLYGEQDLHNPDYLSDPRLRHVLPDSLIKWYSTNAGQWWRQRMLNVAVVSQLVAEGRWQELDAPPIARVSAVLGYFAKGGGKLLFGSDTPSDPTFANPPGLNGRLEMDRWISAGVTPVQLFKAATAANAEFFGLIDEIGTIETGKKADLLITRKNPQDEVAAYDSIDLVILGGKVIQRASLSALSPK